MPKRIDIQSVLIVGARCFPSPLRGSVREGAAARLGFGYRRDMTAERARYLRGHPTEAERRLWAVLRRRQLGGFRFRRQTPIGPFVADFVCLSERLIIEVDGGQHTLRAARDQARTRWLGAQGFCVLRFWNGDVLRNREGVVEAILQALRTGGSPQRAAPPPRPSPARGEGAGTARERSLAKECDARQHLHQRQTT
jgi:very-short-patch-repair endonuclease